MKTLIKHLLANNSEEIIAKSIWNCHTIGLHSIMLLDSPSKTIRLYITGENHLLYRNFPENFDKEFLSLSFHAHHCNLTIECVYGRLLNWKVKQTMDPFGFNIDKYKYKSAIKTGELAFDKVLSCDTLESVEYKFISEGESIEMPASAIHTVAVDKGRVSAWLVYEGLEDSKYESVCYTNGNPNQVKLEGLYQKMPLSAIEHLLKKIDLL